MPIPPSRGGYGPVEAAHNARAPMEVFFILFGIFGGIKGFLRRSRLAKLMEMSPAENGQGTVHLEWWYCPLIVYMSTSFTLAVN